MNRHEPRVRQGAGGGDERLRQGRPFDLPGSGRALVIGDHGIEHQADVLADNLGGGDDQLAGDRIALLRHGRG
jgi:hypothetical protein